MKFTVFGAGGFIGGALAAHLRAGGHDVHTPARNEIPAAGSPLGHVVYAIGLTGDFRSRPIDTVEAHVGALADRLRDAEFESWLYLSSTRVYGPDADAEAHEDAELRGRPDIYDLSKRTGEALCLALPQQTARAARVSNVYGTGAHGNSFLGMLLADIAAGRDISIGEAPGSSKDYVDIADLCRMIEHVATRGSHRLYNLASGTPVTHGEIAEVIERETGRRVTFAPGGATRAFPRIDTGRILSETHFEPARLVARLPELIADIMPAGATGGQTTAAQ